MAQNYPTAYLAESCSLALSGKCEWNVENKKLLRVLKQK